MDKATNDVISFGSIALTGFESVRKEQVMAWKELRKAPRGFAGFLRVS